MKLKHWLIVVISNNTYYNCYVKAYTLLEAFKLIDKRHNFDKFKRSVQNIIKIDEETFIYNTSKSEEIENDKA